MLEIERELSRLHHRDLLAEAERERLARQARRAARAVWMVAPARRASGVAPWRLWVGRHLVQWGAALAADAGQGEAGLCRTCS
ncbi:MAG: hypothetical protein NVSMB65_16050 [Chloroflexota bacterium]